MNREHSRLLVVEGDTEFCDILTASASMIDNLTLIGKTGSEKEALSILKEKMVDILLVDLELGEGTGLHLIEKLRTGNKPVPVMIVMTDSNSRTIRNIINDQDVDLVYHKTEMTYDCEQITYLIEKIVKCRSGDPDTERGTDDLKKQVQQKLEEFGFPKKYTGTAYLAEAVCIAAGREDRVCNLKKDIYAEVAEIFGATVSRVESNIRFVIDQVWLKQNLERLKIQYPFEYDNTNGKPTNKSFILNIAGMFTGRK